MKVENAPVPDRAPIGWHGLLADEAEAWIAAGADPFTARRWKIAGVNWPEERPDGIDSPQSAVLCRSAGVPVTPEWARTCDEVDNDLAAIGYQQGRSAGEVLAFGRAVKQGHALPRPEQGWSPTGFTDALRAAARATADLDWSDVAACVGVGAMTLDQARTHLASGADMAALRLMAALDERP